MNRMPLTKKAQVLEVLRTGGEIQTDGRLLHLIGPGGKRVDAWQTAVKLASKAFERERVSAEVAMAAIAIADDYVRSEIECWCEGHAGNDGYTWWDTGAPCGISGSAAHRQEALDTLRRALRYIDMRSPDVFPWRLVRDPAEPCLVRFEDRQ